MASGADKKKRKSHRLKTTQRKRCRRPRKVSSSASDTADEGEAGSLAEMQEGTEVWACKRPGCGATFALRRSLRRHQMAVHNSCTACEHCERRFKSATYARAHAETCQLNPNVSTTAAAVDDDDDNKPAEGSFQCGSCGGSYGNAISFRSHLSYCRAQRPAGSELSCQLCSATFTRVHDLKRHVQLTHNREKQHTCQVCFKPFGRTSHLRRHMEAVHSAGRICKTKKKVKSSGAAARVALLSTDDDDEGEDQGDSSQSLLCPFSNCGQELPDVAQLQRHLALHCGGRSADDAADGEPGSSGGEAVKAVPLVAETPSRSPPTPSRRRRRLAKAPDPFMCPMDRICCTSFSRYQHLVRHVRTTHKHLFAGGRDLLRRCTSLRLEAGGQIQRAQLRRSAMARPVVEVAFDSIVGSE